MNYYIYHLYDLYLPAYLTFAFGTVSQHPDKEKNKCDEKANTTEIEFQAIKSSQ